MIFRLSPAPTATRRPEMGFSLVEVTLAIGLLAFCLIPLMGLIPTGLNAQHSAAERVLAVNSLTMLSTAVYSSQIKSRDATGAVTYRLPQYLCDSTDPLNNPTTYTSGKDATTYAYAVLDDGTIRNTKNVSAARQTMYVKIFPPATNAQISSQTVGVVPTPSTAVRVYVLIAWPALATDTPTMPPSQLKGRQGFIESFITYVPPN